jgi:hypothetical protein
MNRIPFSVISGLSVSFWEKTFYPAWLWRASSVSGEDVVVTPPKLCLEPGVLPCRKTHPSHYSDSTPNSSWEAPSIHLSFSVCQKACPPGLWAPFRFPHPISWEPSLAGPALTCPQTASLHQAAGIAKCSDTKQAFPNTTDAEVGKPGVVKEVGGKKKWGYSMHEGTLVF